MDRRGLLRINVGVLHKLLKLPPTISIERTLVEPDKHEPDTITFVLAGTPDAPLPIVAEGCYIPVVDYADLSPD